MGRAGDYIKRRTEELLRTQMKKFIEKSSQPQDQTSIGQITPDGKHVTLPSGEVYDVIIDGIPQSTSPVIKIDSSTYYMPDPKIPFKRLDASPGSPYVVYFNSGSLYMAKGKDAPYPLDPALIPSGKSSYPLPVFCNESPALLVYGFYSTGAFVLTLKWGILTNFKLSGGVWTGTITSGTIDVDLSGIPQPSHPSLIPQDPLGRYGQPVEVRSSLFIGFTSLGIHNIFPQVLFWKDGSGDFHFGVCGSYTIDYQSVQNAQNDGTHYQFYLDNTLSGRFLVDINQRTGASSLSYVQDLSSIAFCTWTVIGTAVILNDPNYTVSGYLNGVMGGTPPEPSSTFFRSKTGVFASALQTFNSYFDPNNHWCSPWNAALPASTEPNTPWVTFSDTEYLTNGAAFGSPAQVKALDSESFLTISLGNYLQKYKGPTITAGSKYYIADPGPGYTLIGLGSFAVY